MKGWSVVLPALASALLLSCGRPADTHWADGNFKVYALDLDFTETKLGYDYRPGMLGLVASEVIAAGSSSEWVFAERIDRATGRSEFFIIPKEGMPTNHSGTVEGPFSANQFNELRASRKLPDFSWRKKR
jgi:hypothetical protein